MAQEGTYRTFVKLDLHERRILRNLQELMAQKTGKKPSMSEALRAVIRDYWAVLDESKRPNLIH